MPFEAAAADRRLTLHDSDRHFLSSRFFQALARESYGVEASAAADRVLGELGWEPPGAPEALPTGASLPRVSSVTAISAEADR